MRRAYFHRLGEAAAAKCMSCNNSQYRPLLPGSPRRTVAFQPAKIRCEEGVHTFYSLKAKGLFTTICLLKSPRSRARRAILECGFWEPRSLAQ